MPPLQDKLVVMLSQEEEKMRKTIFYFLYYKAQAHILVIDLLTQGMAWMTRMCLMVFVLCTSFVGGIIVERLWY